MRTFTGFILVGSLALMGCASETAPDAKSGNGGAAAKGGMASGMAGGMAGGMASGMAGGMAGGMGAGMAGGMAAEAPVPAKPYVPKRGPAIDFAPGGPVSDEGLADYHVVMACKVDGEDVGSMTFELWSEGAPKTVRNFLRYCDEGFYDGLIFHRVLRDVMAQSGDSTGTGSGDGPHGTVPAEFSEAQERAHHYGVLSMARSADPNSGSSQFFIITDEGFDVWGFDGQYTSFGRLTGGVSTLEAIANVPVMSAGGPEVSSPTKKVEITSAEVHEGPAPTGEEIARPPVELDLGGAPDRIVLQHVLLAFDGVQGLQVTRTKEEAEALATKLLAEARGGADFDELVRTHSDDTVPDGDTSPGVYRLMNTGARNREAERALYAMNITYKVKRESIDEQIAVGDLDAAGAQEAQQALLAATQAEADEHMWGTREQMVPAFGDVGFLLEVGEVGLAPFDPAKSPYGWHVIKRLE
ncbi:MAG: peptidyl-prolyl cis-trans isomerase B (cyclophilin B) [Chlamydiales bacterium]